MEEAAGSGPTNNESHEEADKRGQSCSDRGDTGGFGMQIDSAVLRGLKEGPNTIGCGDQTNLARINITTLPLDLKPVNLAALTDETGNNSHTDVNADVEKQHCLPLTNTEEQEVTDTASGGNKTDLKSKDPDTLRDTLQQSRKLCFKSKCLTRSFQHNASIDHLSVFPQTNCDGQHEVLDTPFEHHNSVSKTIESAGFRTSFHLLDGLGPGASFTKENNNTRNSCITASKQGTLSPASSAVMNMVNATDTIRNCEYRSELFGVGDYKENGDNVKIVGLDRVPSQESACEESQVGTTLPGAAQSPECNLSAEVLINGTSSASQEDAISEARTESSNSVNVEQEMVQISEDSRFLLEIFHESSTSSGAANALDDLSYELQQGYRILNGFLLEKHRSLTTPFMNPVSKKEFGDYNSRTQEPMWLRRMQQKFVNGEYETITDFVGDFRLMLENCYRYHGVDHWLSKQAQKLEMMLEQKLTLLSRPLRGKTALAMTSKGRYGSEEEKVLVSTSTRRRTTPRNLGAIATGARESIMVQALRLEEQQRAKDVRRQREQDRKETEEATAKELEEWERSLLAQACPQPMDALWEVPAIGHFLCLAQHALKLPEIIFYELERFLLMPRCSVFLAKVMTSLLSHPQQRHTLHRRPALSYRSWEAALRQSVQRWYVAVGQAEDQRVCAEQLGLCPQFFRVLGEVSPLEEKPFHLLPFYQRVWLLKGLCDWVYETQKEVQDAVLSQPIHECRESILGYDGQENAYIHFPHFCGADLRIYCQSPSASPEFPLPICVKRLQSEHNRQEQQAALGGPSPESNVKRNKRMVQESPGCGSDSRKGGENDTRQNHLGHTVWKTRTRELTDKQYGCSSEREGGGNGVSEGVRRIITEWGDRKGSASDEGSLSGDRDLVFNTIFIGEDSLKRIKMEGGDITAIKEEIGCNISPKREASVKAQVPDSNLCTKWRVAVREAERNCEAKKCRESFPPCWENQEKIVGFGAPLSPGEIRIQDNGIPPSTQGPCRACGTLPANESHENKAHSCPAPSAMKRASPEHSAPESQTEGKAGRMRTKKKKKKKKKKVKEAVSSEGKARPGRQRQNLAQCTWPDLQQTIVAKAAKHKKHKSGKKSESKKTTVKKRKTCLQLPFEPGFQLVCTNVEELRALIRKTEGELKEIENMRKKSGRWYFKRQSVKELHCTLVRLLNELLPWEPKLIKAFQRNRARLKKDFDDFKRHPDHNNFVREVWTEEEGGGDLGKDSSSTETNRPTDGAEKQEVLKQELTGMEDSRQQGLELPVGRNRPLRSVCQEGLKLQPKNPKRRQSSSTDDELTPKKRTKLGNSEDHAVALAETQLSNLKPAMKHSTTETSKAVPVFTKGDKPIQALLAKNVGNKVTLINQLPVTSSQTSNKVAVVPLEKPLTTGQGPTKNPLQMLYKMPDNSCVPFDLLSDRGSGSVKIAMQPILDQKTGEKVLQKVVILPRNLLQHHKHLEMETKQNQPSITPNKASPGSFFDSFGTVQLDDLSKIPVQQVAPLSEVPQTEPAGISPKPNYLGASSSKFAPGQSSAQTPSSSRAVAASVSAAETSKSSDSMQELKTVCIRDSQSILVTTRGGNTGIVKVQTNPDHSTSGSLPPSPIFTFPPGFKAFLVSKSASSSAAASAKTCSATTSPGLTRFGGSSISSLSQVPSSISIPFSRAIGNSVCQTQPQKKMGFGQVTLSKSTMSSSTLATTTQALSGTLHSIINMAAGSVGAVSTESFGKTSMVVTQAPLAQYATKLLTKRALPESEAGSADRAPIQKVILVTPPSIVTPCGSASKFSPPALAAPFHTQKLMFISPTSATATESLIGAPKTPEKVAAMDPSMNPHAAVPTFSQIRDVKSGLNIGQAIVNAAANNLQKVRAINLAPSLAARITEDPLNHGRQTNMSAPGADADVRTAVSSTTANATHSDFSSSVNPGPISNRKTVSVSTVKAGHLASSVLIAASHQQCVSSVSSPVPTMGSPKAAQSRSNHLKTSPIPCTSNLPQKDVTDGNIQLLRTLVSSQAVGHPRSPATLCTASFPVCAISTTFSQSQSQVPQNVSKPTQIFNTPVPAPRAVAQSATVNLLSESSVQQKIVINTSTPLAPGTQIVINNTRLIVPPQGLGPGSHVLLISSPGMSPTGNVTGGPPNQKAIPVPSGPVCLPGNQNPRSLPSTSAQTSNALNKSQPPSTVNLTLHSAKTHALPLATASSDLVMAVEKPLTLPIGTNPLPTGNAMSAAQVSHLMTDNKIAVPAAQQSLRETVKTLAEGKGLPIAAVQAVGNFVKGPVIATAPCVASFVNTTKTAPAHATLANMISKAQLSPLTPTFQPIGVSRPQTLPTATVPPIGSTISRIQTLPVATVPPIGSTITKTQACPIASLPPSEHPLL
ncbi:uncharacterized protein KIAA2026-like [Polyodon spathula]|uniref:uncharacterized protein KIAA2026-like n=1 Tax=Polyodon spathula TaxID=7913 RepID=UPI001B7E70DD|nr:uncharacterized protein KIAA2026-like [Polyodon spathula]